MIEILHQNNKISVVPNSEWIREVPGPRSARIPCEVRWAVAQKRPYGCRSDAHRPLRRLCEPAPLSSQECHGLSPKEQQRGSISWVAANRCVCWTGVGIRRIALATQDLASDDRRPLCTPQKGFIPGTKVGLRGDLEESSVKHNSAIKPFRQPLKNGTHDLLARQHLPKEGGPAPIRSLIAMMKRPDPIFR